MGSFKKSVNEFSVEAKENASLIFRTAISNLHEEVIRPKSSGGNLPHDTGNLGRSVTLSANHIDIDTESKDYIAQDVGAAVASVEYGDTMYLGFQAAYAPRMNYGFVGTDSLGRKYNQIGNYFLENGEALWPTIVKEAEAKFGE